MDQDGGLARIRQYEIDTLIAELAYHEKLSAARLPEGTQGIIKNLQMRQDIVAFIESKSGGLIITFLQHSIWWVKHRLQRWRGLASAPGQTKALQAKQYSAPNLSETAYDKAILISRPRILIDVTPTSRSPEAHGGIPRVVRELARAAVETGLALPVYCAGGKLFSYYTHPALEEPITAGSNDVYVIIDIFWYYLDQYEAVLKSLRQNDVKTAVLVHDLFPLKFPSFYPPEVPARYKDGLKKFLLQSDYCLCNSKSTQEDIQTYLKDIGFKNMARIKFDLLHLGVTLPPDHDDGDVRKFVSDLFSDNFVFLSVGTLEPRKGYGISLDACELAWNRGADFSYVIIGRHGWRYHALKERICGHKEYGRRLFWIQDANDKELAFAYGRCRSLVQASIAEGFGLPLIEAAMLNAPVIASDIAVFREIGGEEIAYFPVASAPHLAAKLEACLGAPRRPVKIPVRTWAAALYELSASLSLRDNGA